MNLRYLLLITTLVTACVLPCVSSVDDSKEA